MKHCPVCVCVCVSIKWFFHSFLKNYKKNMATFFSTYLLINTINQTIMNSKQTLINFNKITLIYIFFDIHSAMQNFNFFLIKLLPQSPDRQKIWHQKWGCYVIIIRLTITDITMTLFIYKWKKLNFKWTKNWYDRFIIIISKSNFK